MVIPVEVEVRDFNGQLYRRLEVYQTKQVAEGAAEKLRREGHLSEVTRRGPRRFIPGSKFFEAWVHYVH